MTSKELKMAFGFKLVPMVIKNNIIMKISMLIQYKLVLICVLSCSITYAQNTNKNDIDTLFKDYKFWVFDVDKYENIFYIKKDKNIY